MVLATRAAAVVFCMMPLFATEYGAKPTVDDDIAIKPAASS